MEFIEKVKEEHFNTSHVNVNPTCLSDMWIFVNISIHLMLMLIQWI